MTDPGRSEITRIVRGAISEGADPGAPPEQLFDLVYAELRDMATGLMREERSDHTLQSTALVHEAYLRLVDASLDWQGRAHFFGAAARAMRQVLVDHARRRAADKRGGDWERVTLHDDLAMPAVSDAELLELDDVLTGLGEEDPRMARIVELRVFAGLTGKEIGQVLGLSRQTVQEEWKVARMWLRHRLTDGAER